MVEVESLVLLVIHTLPYTREGEPGRIISARQGQRLTKEEDIEEENVVKLTEQQRKELEALRQNACQMKSTLSDIPERPITDWSKAKNGAPFYRPNLEGFQPEDWN